jgi:hypothetical protein
MASPGARVRLVGQFRHLQGGGNAEEIPAETIGRRSADCPGIKHLANGSSQE